VSPQGARHGLAPLGIALGLQLGIAAIARNVERHKRLAIVEHELRHLLASAFAHMYSSLRSSRLAIVAVLIMPRSTATQARARRRRAGLPLAVGKFLAQPTHGAIEMMELGFVDAVDASNWAVASTDAEL
jgi:hypothetical protein